MPDGWYQRNLAGARTHAIEFFKQKSLLVCEMLDGRVFRFREHFPSMPVSKAERKGMACLYESATAAGRDDSSVHDALSEEVHDDEAPTPAIELARFARWTHELGQHPLSDGIKCMEGK